jgi:DNA-binding response OmpR family regulator
VKPPYRVLHVDDDEDIATIVKLCLGLDGAFEVRTADSASGAYEILAGLWNPDLLLLDVQLGTESGLDVFERTKARHPKLPVILMTASVTGEQRAAYRAMGVDDVIAKPFDPLALAADIASVIEYRRLQEAPGAPA